MKIKASRWLASSFWVSAWALLILATGLIATTVADGNLRRQKYYMSTIRYQPPSEAFSTSIVTSPEVRWLIAHSFFSDSTKEAVELRPVLAAAPKLFDGRYFADIRDMMNYAKVMGSVEEVYSVAKAAIDSGILAQSKICANFRTCNADEDANVNDENGAILFDLVVQEFLDPAVNAMSRGNAELAARLATRALALGRIVNMDHDRTTKEYNRILVLGAFLSDLGSNQTLEPNDLKALEAVINMETDQPPISANELVATYQLGIGLLRRGCFSDASRVFADSVSDDIAGPLAELFAFLSIRAVATPFILLRDLKRASDQLLVTDCGEDTPLASIVASFDARVAELERWVRHPGLASDVTYFSKKAPHSQEQFSVLSSRVAYQQTVAFESLRPSAPMGVQTVAVPPEPTLVTSSSVMALAEAADDGKFRWPVHGRVVTDFAASRGTGINIEAPEGTPVHATLNGRVIYVGSGVEGYGNLILLRHPGGYVSAYAHMASASALKDALVMKGEVIGTVGKSGSVTKSQLHFEIRRGAIPVDPAPILNFSLTEATANDLPIDQRIAEANEVLSTIINGVAVIPTVPEGTWPVKASAEASDSQPTDNPEVVTAIQHGLRQLGFSNATPDGILGEATRKAIRNFEVYFNYRVTGQATLELVDRLTQAGASF